MTKRLIWGLLVAVLVTSGLGLPVSAGVEDFKFDSLSVEFHLSRDDNRRAVLDVKETFVAVFPDFDQNRGIVREIPLSFQGHPLNLDLGEIYRDGELLKPAADSTADGVRRLELRRGNQYVYGTHTYEINYRLHDVILSPDDTQNQELYWDVNGTNWRQSFGSVRATLILADDLAETLTGQLACYTGREGSTERACTISRDANLIKIVANRDFLARENLTFAVEFAQGTFAPYEMKPIWANLAKAGLIATGAALIILIVMSIRWVKVADGEKIEGAVVTQYLPPKNVDVMQAATLLKRSNGPSATLIDLAVRHQITISEVQPAKGVLNLSRKPDYKLEIISTDKMSTNDKAILRSFMKQPKSLKVGMAHVLNRAQPDESLPSRLSKVAKKVFKQLKKDGFYRAAKELWQPIIGWLLATLVIGGLVMLLSTVNEITYSVYNFYLSFAGMITLTWSIILIVSFVTARPKTQRGAKVYHYLQGLKQYIKLAEVDRLAFLQGAGTAQIVPNAKSEAERRVVLYERVLPYAVLFGLEKSWSKVLEATYQEAGVTPAWFVGTHAFSASNFVSSVSNFSSYSSSSSSSGSSGGGSSGGGGGGGGGGGC